MDYTKKNTTFRYSNKNSIIFRKSEVSRSLYESRGKIAFDVSLFSDLYSDTNDYFFIEIFSLINLNIMMKFIYSWYKEICSISISLNPKYFSRFVTSYYKTLPTFPSSLNSGNLLISTPFLYKITVGNYLLKPDILIFNFADCFSCTPKLIFKKENFGC